MENRQQTTNGWWLILSAVCWVLGAGVVHADSLHLIRYQGQAVDSQGVPLEGPYTLAFRLYDATTGGTKEWEEVQPNVPLQGGHFSVLLGQVTPLDGMNWSQPCWLSVQVGIDPELAPRQRITSVPMAIVAEQLAGPIRTAGTKVGIGTAIPAGVLSVWGASAGYGADVTLGGVASASYVDPCCPPANAFDSNNTTTWGINSVSSVTSYPVWLKYDFSAGNEKTIVKYTITPDRCGTNPGIWRFEGSNDNVTWTTLDNRSSFGSCAVGIAFPFTFTNSTPYRYYRLYILAPANGNPAYDLDFLDMAMMEGGPGSVLEVTDRGNIGIGVEDPTNILTVKSGSSTDPIADSWTVYPSDRQHKKILRTAARGYLDQVKAVEVYEWTRAPQVSDEEARCCLGAEKHTPEGLEAKKQELIAAKCKLPKFSTKRVGVAIDDANVPTEILTFNADGTKGGIDLLAYVGYLHAALREAALRIEALESQLGDKPKR